MQVRGMTHWKVQIDPGKVFYLKFILEGYDNIATMSTVDQESGIIKLCISPGNEDTLSELLAAMAERIGLKTVIRT